MLMQILDWFRCQEEEGQTLIEYALILVLISVVVIVVLTLVGTNVDAVFQNIADALTTTE